MLFSTKEERRIQQRYKIVSRNSEFQLINAAQKRVPVHMTYSKRNVDFHCIRTFVKALWTVYEEETWNQLVHIAGQTVDLTSVHIEIKYLGCKPFCLWTKVKS